MKDLVEFLAKKIVDKPRQVKVEEGKDEYQTNLKLVVDQVDMGKVIGKMGRIIKAIRNLVRVRAVKEGKRVYLELIEQNIPVDKDGKN